MPTQRDRIAAILGSMPEVVLEPGGECDQHLGASVRGKRFAWFLDDHHGDGIIAVTCRAAAGVNEAMVGAEPDRYFIPSYTGPRGWIGIRLDIDDTDWDRVDLSLADAYRMTAPRSLVARLDQG